MCPHQADQFLCALRRCCRYPGGGGGYRGGGQFAASGYEEGGERGQGRRGGSDGERGSERDEAASVAGTLASVGEVRDFETRLFWWRPLFFFKYTNDFF